MKRFVCGTALLALGMALSSTVHADTYVWTFATSPPGSGDVGASKTYTVTGSVGSVDLTAFGFDSGTSNAGLAVSDTWNAAPTVAHDLYEKYTAGTPSETGLGLNGTTDNEINDKQFIQLDVAQIKAKGLSNLVLKVGSVQGNEGYDIFGSNDAGAGKPGVLLYQGTGGDLDTVNIDNAYLAAYKYISVSAYVPAGANANPDSNVLVLNGLSAQAIPEPAFYQLGALAGLGSVGLLRLRRRKSA